MTIFNDIHYWFHSEILHKPGGHELLYISFKLIMGFTILLIVSRLLGKKELHQYTPMDFIFVILLSGLLEETVYHHDTPWYEFILAIVVWCLLTVIVEKTVQRFEGLRPVVKGQPIFLIKKGVIDDDALRKANLEYEQLRHALRSKGVFSLFEVDYAVLETNGEINVQKKPAYQNAQREHVDPILPRQTEEYPVMVIENGRFVEPSQSGISIASVQYDLERHGLEIEEVQYAERVGDKFYFKLKGGGDDGSTSETN